jgi:hypothetical protein
LTRLGQGHPLATGTMSLPFGCCCHGKKEHGEARQDSDSDEEYFPHLRPFLYRLSVLIFSILQNGSLSGLVFGWASIDHTLLSAPYNQGGTQLTVHETTAMFTWASSIGMASPLLLGVFLDRYGPRWCSVLSCGIVGLGFQVFSLSQSFPSLAVGLCLIALGGPGILASIVHLSNLFPDYENLVMSLLSGSTALSFSVFTVFDALWEHYPTVITYKTLFGTYVWIAGLMAVGSYYLFPDEPYEKWDEFEYLGKEEEEEDGDNGGDDFAPAEGKLFDSSSTIKLLVEVDPHEKKPLAQQPLQQHASSLPPPHGHEESKDDEHKVHHHHHHPHHPQHHHHSHLHVSTISHQPSLTGIEQSLDSYLRNGDTMGGGSGVSFAARMSKAHAGPTDSFRQSQWAFQSGKLELMSLKDQPFYVQLFSAMYFRSLLVFISTAYWSNFYVASISTEASNNEI